MGNAKSFEENLKEKNNNINAMHADLDLTMKRIEKEAERIIEIIRMRHYNDRDAICKQIGVQKVDELSQFFPIQTLEGVRYRLGLTPQMTAPLESLKNKTCVDIVNFYVKKINLITSVEKELPNCRNMEQDIYNDLTKKLKAEQLNTTEWLTIYEKMEKFNKDIKSRYQLVEREVERIRLAKNMAELDAIARTTNKILSDTNAICKNHETDLFRFSNRAAQFEQREKVEIASAMLKEEKREQSFLASYSLPTSPLRVATSPRAEVVSPLRIPVSPRFEMRPQQYPPQFRETVQEYPVHERVIRRPKTVSQEIVEEEHLPTIPMNSGLEVRETVHEYPVHERVIRRPVTVSQETVNPPPAVSSTEHRTIHRTAMANSPPNSPGFMHSTEHTTTRSGDREVHSTVHTTEPTNFPSVLSASRPVMPFYERREATIRPKKVTVRADSVQKVGSTVYMKNPTKVEVTQFVPKHRVEVTRKVPASVVRVEPVTIARSRTVQKEQGRPVVAARDHIPAHPSEIGVQQGEPLLYLGSSANMWSRVRKHTGEEGYIPHVAINR